ncbi:uncharacterized protein tex12 [Genypterus blacodes]|uniref:uncharacterized protein tex12 n=1 Tax=Genypterus blacodes TaxID=154954 RepID=UPI003F76F61B
MEQTAVSPDKESFDTTAAGVSSEVSMLFSSYAEALSESAAADSAQMKELELILEEARKLQSHRREKKANLRQTLESISEQLEA